MRNLKELQREIIANRERRGWESAHNLLHTTAGLAEEVGEFEQARRKKDRDSMLRELADVMVYCLGAFEILEGDVVEVVRSVVENNKTRTVVGGH